MKSFNTYSRLMLFAAAVAFLAACSATSDNDKKAQLEKLKAQQAELGTKITALEEAIAKEDPNATTVKLKEVSVSALTPRKFEHYVQTQGAIEAEDNIQTSAKSAGVITQVYVKEGQAVTRGQVLAQIDNSVLLRSIEQLKSQVDLASTVYQRQKNLWDQKIGTEVQYLQAKTNMESLERQLESLKEQSEMSRIKSPINGTVDEVSAKIGENIAPGMPAFRVVNTSDLKVKANISEAYVTKIQKGDKVKVLIPDLNKEMEAKVTFVGKNIDVLSRTFAVEVKLPSSPNLRPNMTTIVKVVFQSEDAALVVPVNVVQTINGEKVVYVAEKNGNKTVARKKTVQVDGVYDNLAQVTKGLSSGDEIITVGYQGLNDGEQIKI